MAVCLPRYLGPVETLSVGMWCLTHRGPAIRCDSCGGIDYIDADRVQPSGSVNLRHTCETATCSRQSWIVLEAWAE